jgi:SAM-dependent methyltransferase
MTVAARATISAANSSSPGDGVSKADLDRWEARWREREGLPGAPERFLTQALRDVPPCTVLDVAAGDGRNALWLARAGFAVTAVDIAPAAIARLAAAADGQGLRIATRVADLDRPDALAGLAPFAAMVVARFKPSAAQWDRLLEVLEPGGRLFLCSFRNAHHAVHGFPLAYCLDRAELVSLLTPRLKLLSWEERDEGPDLVAASVWERPAAEG